MPTDPTPTAADFEAARDLRNVVHRYSCGTVGIDVVDDALARAIATAREAGQDVEVGRRRRLIDRARAEADAAGYARGLREAAERIRALPCLDPAHDDRHCPACDERERCAAELAPPPTPEPTPDTRADILMRAEAFLDREGEAPIWERRNELLRLIRDVAAEARGRCASPPTPEPMPPDDIAEQWEDCTGLPDCPGCRVRHPDAPGMCGGFAADTPPTPEPTQPCCGCDSAEEPADCECADYCPHDGPCQCDCHRGPTPASGCLTCGGAGSVPTGAYGETEERDERVACPTCDGDGGGAPEPTPSRRALPEQREWVPPGERDGGGS